MKSVSFTHMALFALFVLFGVVAYNLYDLKKTQEEINLKQDLVNRHLLVRIDSTEDIAIKSTIYNQALAKSVLYLDSCQQAKTVKQDKAERRGKFVGGLLRSLFPGI